MQDMSRREFFARSAIGGIAGAATLAAPAPAYAAEPGALGTFIDLTLCQGCGECVSACRVKNADRFPKPVEDIPVNWPTGKFEDWRHMSEATDRLTPYNWLYVESVDVDGTTINVPRRCMHCDNPACANLCPFGSMEKTAEGAVVVDHASCFGGAKCRSVCPWSIPQRQAGVGVYMDVLPGVVGGGVMYKCDMCADLIAEGEQPACVTACPIGATRFGSKDEMRALAEQRAAEIGGFVYGAEEGGGTSTFYVSPVPFDAIDAAISERKAEMPEGQRVSVPHMATGVENELDSGVGLVKSFAVAPVLGVAVAAVAATKAFKKGEA